MSRRDFGLRHLWLRPLKSNRRTGFTLVELLVVISIIGMLMALLLPAVQQAREAGRRNTCNSNLHNVAIAVMNFATSKNSYPGYVEPLSLTTSGAASGGSNTMYYPVSWIVPILPYMERTDVYTLWRNQPNWNVAFPPSSGAYPPPVYMSVLNCPSSPVSITTSNTPCAYVANSGMMDALATSASPADWQANGVFFNHFNQVVGQIYNAGTTIPDGVSQLETLPVQSASISQDYITVHDGSSLTLMLSENNNAPLATLAASGTNPVTAAGNPNPGPGYWGTGTGAPTSGSKYMWGTEPQNCFVWWPDANPLPQMKINAPIPGSAVSAAAGGGGSGSNVNYNYFMHPASNHPTGVNVAFCDGHSQFMSQDIDYTVFCLLMTPYGAYCNTPGYVPASGGTPLDSGTTNATYYPNASNYGPLRTRPIDESQIN